MIYGEKIRQVRELRRLTQSDVARKLQVTQGLIAQIERGRISAPDRIMNAFALMTGFPLTASSAHRPRSFLSDRFCFALMRVRRFKIATRCIGTRRSPLTWCAVC